THPGAPVLGREGLAAGLRQASSLPVWAIGDINGATAPQLAGLPLAGVAAIRGLLQGDDMGKAVAALSRVSTSRS
ncbi:MAG: hypothetical protein ACE5ID_05055, partial [Acidobacteriota bacterium]